MRAGLVERGHEAGAAGQRAGAALLRAQRGHQVRSSTQSLANREIKHLIAALPSTG